MAGSGISPVDTGWHPNGAECATGVERKKSTPSVRFGALRVTAATALLALASACSSSPSGTGKAAACSDLRRVIGSFNSRRPTDPATTGAAYSAAATRINADATRVSNIPVKNAAYQVATALTSLADQMRSLAAGTYLIPDTTPLTTSVATLQAACET